MMQKKKLYTVLLSAILAAFIIGGVGLSHFHAATLLARQPAQSLACLGCSGNSGGPS